MHFTLETLDFLEDFGKKPEDVLWVGTSDGKFAVSFDEFLTMADFEYNNGYGSMNSPSNNLVIVGKDWWLSREDYDGATSWRYNEKPKLSKHPRKDLRFARQQKRLP